jgi:hypothetical protein
LRLILTFTELAWLLSARSRELRRGGIQYADFKALVTGIMVATTIPVTFVRLKEKAPVRLAPWQEKFHYMQQIYPIIPATWCESRR